MVNYKTIKQFSAESGYSVDAINAKISGKVWEQNKVWFKAPDGRRLISVEGYNRWVESAAINFKAPKPSSQRNCPDSEQLQEPPLRPLVLRGGKLWLE